MKRGIIVSVQGYTPITTSELCGEAISAGAIALRTDKPIKFDTGVKFNDFDEKPPIIGLKKIHVHTPSKEAYITTTLVDAQAVAKWAQYVAVDCRRYAPNYRDILAWCSAAGVKVVADIETMEDWAALQGCKYAFVATTFSVFHKNHRPDTQLILDLVKAGEKHIIAEGNYTTRKDVQTVLREGAHAVCLGAAVSNVYKLTRKYTTIDF